MSFNIVIISKPIKSIQDGFNPNQSCFFFLSDVSSVKTLYGFVFREFTLLPIVCFFFCCSYTNQKASLTNRFLGEKIGRLVKGGGGGLIKFIDNKGIIIIIIVIPTI